MYTYIKNQIYMYTWTSFETFRKHLEQFFKTMFLYRVEYNESESDIQNNDLSYKIDQQCQNTFRKNQKGHICILYLV